MNLSHLYEFCTVRQLEVIQAIEKEGSNRKAAKALGVRPNAVDNHLKAVKRKAANRIITEHSDPTRVPDGFLINGTTTLRKDGVEVMQWVKTSADQKRQWELLQLSITALAEDIKGKHRPIKPPEKTLSDLMTVVPVGDPHFGMYAWSDECGDDFDCDIAQRNTIGAAKRLIESTPQTEVFVLLLLGDVFHANDQTNRTPGHGHQLDVDTRFSRVLEIGVRTFRHIIELALEKYKTVVVRIEPGNHDPQAILALRIAMKAYFEADPRVHIDRSPGKFWFYRFGKVLIGSTHGDTVKHEQLLGVMASDQAENWGQTRHRYWYTGHVHHQSVREYPGVICESFRTLAAKDAYAAGHGYRAGRDMVAIIHHREHGEIERHRCDIGMLT